MTHSGVLFIFERHRGPLNVAGPGVCFVLQISCFNIVTISNKKA